MNSQESAINWLNDILEQEKELSENKSLLNQKKADLFMKIELLTKLRHQLQTNMLEIYKNELDEIQAEIKSIDELKEDLRLIHKHLEEQFHLVK